MRICFVILMALLLALLIPLSVVEDSGPKPDDQAFAFWVPIPLPATSSAPGALASIADGGRKCSLIDDETNTEPYRSKPIAEVHQGMAERGAGVIMACACMAQHDVNPTAKHAERRALGSGDHSGTA